MRLTREFHATAVPAFREFMREARARARRVCSDELLALDRSLERHVRLLEDRKGPVRAQQGVGEDRERLLERHEEERREARAGTQALLRAIERLDRKDQGGSGASS